MRFYVFRSGYNTVNNSARDGSPSRVCVAAVEADTPAAACKLAAERVTVYDNQYLDAEEADAINNAEAVIDTAVTLA